MNIIYISFVVLNLIAVLAAQVLSSYLDGAFYRIVFSLDSIFILLIGFMRVASRHPRYRKDYLLWLKSTPWNGGKLPAEEVTLNWQDAFFLLIICSVSYFLGADILCILFLVCFLIGYSIALQLTLPVKTCFIIVYAIPLVAFIVVRYFDVATDFIIVSGTFVMFLLMQLRFYISDRKALFPERDSVLLEFGRLISPVFPFVEKAKVGTFTKMMLAFILPLWLTMIVSLMQFKDLEFFIILTAFGAALLKWSSYGHINYSTGFLYRIKKFILWDKDYDKILIVPFLIMLLAALFCGVYDYIPLNTGLKTFVITSVLLLLAFFGGPGFSEWMLTGKVKLEGYPNLQRQKQKNLQESKVKIIH